MQRYNSYSYEYVKEFINSTGCELISKEYDNCDTKLEMKCRKCGKNYMTTFYCFQISKHKCCKKCASNINTTVKKYDEIKKYIESFGYKLLSKEYKNNTTPLKIKCSCGTKFIINYNRFKNLRHKMCDKCRDNYIRNLKLKESYSDVKNYIENISNSGCKLITTIDNYNFIKNDIEIECVCGNKYITTASNFKYNNDIRCYKCTNKGRIYWNIEKVKQFVEENSDCELLSTEFINVDSRLLFKCVCGNIFETTFDRFKNDSRRKRQCNECSVRSNIEKFCRDYFKEHNIPYEAEKTFPDCRYPITNGVPRFDFYLEYNNRKILIEGNGIQHEKPIRFYNAITQEEAEESFEKQQQNDKYKKQYALDNGYEFVEIWYYDIDKIPQILDTLLQNK